MLNYRNFLYKDFRKLNCIDLQRSKFFDANKIRRKTLSIALASNGTVLTIYAKMIYKS